MTTCPYSFDAAEAGVAGEKDWNRRTEQERAEALARLEKLRRIWDAQEPRPKRLETPRKPAQVSRGALNPLRWEPRE